jgi:NADH-quinone oxidoreductase subunit C
VAEPLNALAKRLKQALGAELAACKADRGELTVTVAPSSILKTLRFLKEDAECLFQCLMDVSGADYPGREKRFEVVYHLLSLSLNQRIRVKVETGEQTPVPSAVAVYRSAGWFEREVWDLYGVLFSGHPDLRRILTDYGFSGHPLRKDFPLTGFVELRYDTTQRRVVYEPVKLAQDFRTFDFLSPWEGAKYVPEDEPGGKAGKK